MRGARAVGLWVEGWLAGLFVCGALLASGACDPIHDDAIAALGPEAPGVPRGPLHRPGQPCLVCHDGDTGDPPRFTIAGTVFLTSAALLPAVGVDVHLIDANGVTEDLQTNAAGNFYTAPEQYDPAFPITASVRGPDGTVSMRTLIEGNGTAEPNGGCASCHFDPAGQASPGHLCLRLEDGGTPL